MNWQSPFPFTYHISTEKKAAKKNMCETVLQGPKLCCS